MAPSAIRRVCRITSPAQLRHELNLIERMKYAPYFLTVNPLSASRVQKAFCVRAAARPPILPYALSSASPRSIRCAKAAVERFVSEERREPPDIDVDFEHERREEVIPWISQTYGRTRFSLDRRRIALSLARRRAGSRQSLGPARRCDPVHLHP